MAVFRLQRGGRLRLGANYRLAYGWDFGPGELSLLNPARLAHVARDFRELASHGAEVVRWFVFNDGRTPVDARFFASLKAGLDTASEAGLAVLAVLLDHTFCFVEPGHGRSIKDPERFERLLGDTLEPLIVTMGAHPAVMGFELMNEPEMAMRRRNWIFGAWSGAGSDRVPKAWQLTFPEMERRMVRCAEVIHRHTAVQFSVGTMASRWLARWESVIDPARDFLTFHYYGGRDERDLERTMETRIAPVAERVAVGLGEFYPCGAQVVPPARIASPWPDIPMGLFFSTALRYRLQLAMPWVWNPGENDPGEISLAEWDRFRQQSG